MPRSNRLRGFGVGFVLSVAWCATVDPTPDYELAKQEIRATTGEEVVHGPDEPVLSGEEIGTMLADGLGLDEATRLALLNNRRIQAGFLALGVARADYVQAGLLENPSLSLAFLFPDGGGRVRWTADLVGSVTEIWQIPSRQACAQAGIDQRILELSRFAGELVDTHVPLGVLPLGTLNHFAKRPSAAPDSRRSRGDHRHWFGASG